MSAVAIRIDGVEGAASRLEAMASALNGQLLATRLGELLRERIWARTAAGLGVDGQPFAPYAEAYEKRRRRRGLPRNRVTLRFTGAMLDALTLTLSPQVATLGFAGRRQARKAAWNHETRPFFGIGHDDRAALRAAAREILNGAES